MSVLLETSAGEIVIDLFVKDAPLASENFLKLCKIKYYHGCLFYNVQPNYILQTGDPTATGKGGQCISGILQNNPTLTFNDEITKSRKMNKIGLVCMANTNEKENSNRSQFFITLRSDDLEHLDGIHTIFGEIAEGFDVLEKLNSLYCDTDGRPYQDVRIQHTFILDDPFPDPLFLDKLIPSQSPEREIPSQEKVKSRIPYDESLENDTIHGKTEEEVEQSIKRKEAYSRALVLEMTGDIPDVDVKPPREVLFICKLNQVTTDADLELIFSRFGTIKQCEIIRDFKTGESLNYAFIEYETEDSCIEAYEKMNNVLIDDRRIKVDFSQSVSKLWNKFLCRPRKETKKELLNLTANTIRVSNNNNNNNTSSTHQSQQLSKQSAQHSQPRIRSSTGNSIGSSDSGGHHLSSTSHSHSLSSVVRSGGDRISTEGGYSDRRSSGSQYNSNMAERDRGRDSNKDLSTRRNERERGDRSRSRERGSDRRGGGSDTSKSSYHHKSDRDDSRDRGRSQHDKRGRRDSSRSRSRDRYRRSS